MEKKTLMLIDGNSLLYRAFYALPLLKNSQGVYTNGVYGFLTMFNRVVNEQKPTHIVVAFDMSRQTFRSEMFTDYKANRQAPPDELQGQFGLLREVLCALNVKYLELSGYEADDIIGTLSRQAEEEGMDSLVLTGDGDSLQLVSERVKVLMTRKGISEMDLYDPEQVKKKWEVGPDKMIEIKALMGDSSDNIPGVPGVGAKTAIKLIKEYGSLENLYQHLPEINGKKLVERLAENRDLAFTSRHLATIIRDLELNCSLDDFQIKAPDLPCLTDLYRQLEFRQLLAGLKESPETEPGAEASPGVACSVVETREEAERLGSGVPAGEGVAVYIESDYQHPMRASILGLYFARDGQVYYLPMGTEAANRLGWVKALLENASIPKYVHNAKFLQVILWRYGIELTGVAGDSLLAAYVDDPAFEGDACSSLMLKYMNLSVDKNDFPSITAQLKPLFDQLHRQLDPDQHELLDEVEMPMSRVLAAMEFTGVKVDRDILAAIGQELAAGIMRDQNRIYDLAGGEFNINSPRQLGQVLFETLGLKVVKKTKTGYATGAEVLEELYDAHEIIPYIMDYRQLTKLKSTYVDALQELIDPASGRVHTVFKQAQTATGRLSSVEPNLQNIPIRMEEGRRIRRAFIAEDQGWVLLSADYSQIDLRSLAHISSDEVLIETFRRNIDIHTRTASEIFKVALDQVTPELRRRAKAVNFGIIYGISDFGLSRGTGVSRQEARRYIDDYLDSYPGVRQYMHDIVEFGQKHGYVETILKRRRYLPELNAKNKMVQSFARRMALNTPIQGTSADIIKLAMIKVSDQLKARKLRARMLLQVHDDLVLEVPRGELEEVARLVKHSMETAYALKVPLLASLKTGDNWYEMKEWRLTEQGILDL